MSKSLRTSSATWPVGVCIAAICLIASCSSKQYAQKTDDVVQRSEDQVEMPDFGAERWCTDFGQSGLETMVQQTWSDNMELKAAWARLEQAKAEANIARAELWPTVDGGADANYSTREFDEGETTAGGDWELSVGAAYEVDIWGRHRKRAKAAELEARAVEAGARSLAMTLTSQVAEAWFDVIAQRKRVDLLERQLDVSRNILDITQDRLRRGLVPALDVAQQKRNIESIRSQLYLAETELQTSRHRLAVLIGETPDDTRYVDADTLPGIEPLPEAGVPADLLERRPDLRASHLRLEAADKRTAAAVADRLPRLRLTASLGFQAEQISRIFQQLFASVGASLTQPIFQGGRLNAEIERSEALAQEQLYNYAQTLLVAIREVRDALTREHNQRKRIQSLREELKHARSVVELARRQYRTGAVDYLRVLTGLEELQQLERTLLDARRQQLSHRISLCRALGGSWVNSVEQSIDSED
jgi:NodT family efflux transporter outer membrane factor (OMF) lipoprotein